MIISFIVGAIAFIIAQVIIASQKAKEEPLNLPNGNLLIFDTETNGMPHKWDGDLEDLDNWPRVLSLSWFLINPHGNELLNAHRLIRNTDFALDESSQRIHGLTPDLLSNGVEINEALLEFMETLRDTKYLVGHNVYFDYAVVYAEFLRSGLNTAELSSVQRICTMISTTQFCAIPSKRGYKYPKLSELYYKLFKQIYPIQHDSRLDAAACLKCFKELYNRKVIKF